MSTRERFQQVVRMERDLRRTVEAQEEIAQSALDLADRLCPGSADATTTLAAALSVPPPAGEPSAGTGAITEELRCPNGGLSPTRQHSACPAPSPLRPDPEGRHGRAGIPGATLPPRNPDRAPIESGRAPLAEK